MILTLREQAEQARRASHLLSNLSTEQKNQALCAIAKALRLQQHKILQANEVDLDNARKLLAEEEITQSTYRRLMLNPDKVEQMARNLESVAALPDPVGVQQMGTRLDDDLDLYRISCPIGVLLVIFEARPEVVIQISALTLKSGNAVILKGGKETQHSNATLFQIAEETLRLFDEIPAGSVNLLQSREAVSTIVQMNDCLDLIIPRGSNALVQHIQQNSRVPVLAHADGICHVYWDAEGDLRKAREIIVDAKTEYPAVCNAMETLLVHQGVPEEHLGKVVTDLHRAGVELRVCEQTRSRLHGLAEISLSDATEEDWHTEYTDMILSIKTVFNGEAALQHIHQYGSGHTDAIITENKICGEWFLNQVDSANVFWNASTRFADGFRYGFGAEVGVSTCKTHARGPVGLDGLVIYKYKLYGNGQGVARYHAGGRAYQHTPLPTPQSASR